MTLKKFKVLVSAAMIEVMIAAGPVSPTVRPVVDSAYERAVK